MNTLFRFKKTGNLKIGYSSSEVDDFLKESQNIYENPTDIKDALLIMNSSFSLVKNGYDIVHVDAALDRLTFATIDKIKENVFRVGGGTAVGDWVAQMTVSISNRIDRPRGHRFSDGIESSPSYDKEQVDRFLDEISLSLLSGGSSRRKLTPQKIQTTLFKVRKGKNGYIESEVDLFLSKVAVVAHVLR